MKGHWAKSVHGHDLSGYRECACGCGETFKRRSNGAGKPEKQYVNIHHCPSTKVKLIPKDRQVVGARRAARLWHELYDVPAEPVQRALRAKWGDQAEAEIRKATGVVKPERYFKATMMRKTTAERLLRLAAGLPRTPARNEKQKTDHLVRARDRKRVRDRKRRQRMKP